VLPLAAPNFFVLKKYAVVPKVVPISDRKIISHQKRGAKEKGAVHVDAIPLFNFFTIIY
jgi:hypothetical protein